MHSFFTIVSKIIVISGQQSLRQGNYSSNDLRELNGISIEKFIEHTYNYSKKSLLVFKLIAFVKGSIGRFIKVGIYQIKK